MSHLTPEPNDDSDDDAPKEEATPIGIPRFHVSQDDLVELERIVPELYSRLMLECHKDRKCRSMFVKLKTIVSNIRWDYGPHTYVGQVPAD